jgi:hypothetical protein
MLPDFIVIGAMKCGTTSLHHYLGHHPEIGMSKKKELNFFVEDGRWSKGLEWYQSNFKGPARIYGEASPKYTSFPTSPGIPERMHAVVPQAKLIYIVRDPIERILSHYVHSLAELREHRPIEEALADFEENEYICRSMYYMQLEQYLVFYPKSSILVINHDDLYHRRRQTLQGVFRFLEVDETFDTPKFSTMVHLSRKKRRKTPTGVWLSQLPMIRPLRRLPSPWRRRVDKLLFYPFSRSIPRPGLPEELRQTLVRHLKPDTDRLREMTGQRFDGWCV